MRITPGFRHGWQCKPTGNDEQRAEGGTLAFTAFGMTGRYIASGTSQAGYRLAGSWFREFVMPLGGGGFVLSVEVWALGGGGGRGYTSVFIFVIFFMGSPARPRPRHSIPFGSMYFFALFNSQKSRRIIHRRVWIEIRRFQLAP